MTGTVSPTGVFRVEGTLLPGVYESALVLAVPPRLRECVLGVRAVSRHAAPREFQLEPHMTVLFLGRMDAQRLNALATELRTLSTSTASTVCEGFGVFRNGTMICNLHVKIRRDEPLVGLHESARKICARAGWTPQTVWVGDRYAPHVSILDRIEVSESAFELPDAALLPREEIKLIDLHQIAKKV